MQLETDSYTPLILLVEDQEWTARSLQSILAPRGFAFSRAKTGRRGIQMADDLVADLVIVAAHLPDMPGVDVIHAMVERLGVTPATPIVLFTTQPQTRKERQKGFEAGAWAIFRPPFDAHELTLRFETWIRAKREADVARDTGLVDTDTGSYNFRGLLRRSQELLSEAVRYQKPISFLIFGPASRKAAARDDDEVTMDPPVPSLGRLLLATCRLCDAVARISEREFVVVAPGTNAAGARKLALRVVEEGRQNALPLKVGISSTRGGNRTPLMPLDLLGQATEALRRAQAEMRGMEKGQENGGGGSHT